MPPRRTSPAPTRQRPQTAEQLAGLVALNVAPNVLVTGMLTPLGAIGSTIRNPLATAQQAIQFSASQQGNTAFGATPDFTLIQRTTGAYLRLTRATELAARQTRFR